MIDLSKTPEDMDITCPRCSQQKTVRLYGPCESCRGELRATQHGEKSDVTAEEYVPKMNVTPNAIASKD